MVLSMTPLRVGFLGYENANALDLVGPAEAFASALRDNGRGKLERCYKVSTIGLTRRSFAAESGIVFKPTVTIETAPKLDTLIVPGGCGLRGSDVNRRVSGWVLARAKTTRRIASVCTGIYGLAATGLLDGRRVTTHWRWVADVAKRFPKLKMEPNALFVKDGAFYTSAGVTAGIDLALALIEEDFGSKVALSVAREMVVYLKRSGGQEQYSEPLQFQTNSSDRFAELVAWMTNNPTKQMSVESLARRASLSPRQFFRRFKEHFGSSPAMFVETLRLNEARCRLTAGETSIEGVAESVGFNGSDSFRRAFERRFRVTPSKYRRSFGVHNGK
jgi:transcriptional regulator GlxA family with amidase domain